MKPPTEINADPSHPAEHSYQWYGSGYALLEAKLQAIAAAQVSIRMETYIYVDEHIGQRFRDALVAAGQRGVSVQLLVDAVGGGDLPASYFDDLADLKGCQMKWFNEVSLASWSFRDHRKLLVIDSHITFVGGCNIAEDYHGDGLDKGWRDGGLRIEGDVAREIEHEMDQQFASADFTQWRVQLQKSKRRKPHVSGVANVKPLFVHPGFGQSPLRDAMRKDLAQAKDIAITSAYFLPSEGLRRQLASAVGRGARLRLLLGGKSDVKLMQLASQSLYPRLLNSGLEVYEYQPQILHAKMLIIDDAVYMGSSNLDPRSLRINFEVMLRIVDPALAKIARDQFEVDLVHSKRVSHEQCWEQGWWTQLKQRFARWLLASGDPRMAEGMLRRLQGSR